MGILGDVVRIFPLFVGRKNRAARIYDLLSNRQVLGEGSLYLNMGYWEDGASYDEACEALARVLAEAVDLREGHVLLDCGFGFGDQDLFWMERFRPGRIVGLNITRSQVARARVRVEQRGLADRIQLLHGSATAMPVAGASVDRVTALETAFHYDTRETFFREAFRVLRPGGRLATADVTPLPDIDGGLRSRFAWYLMRSYTQIPEENIYSRVEYASRLQEVGFENVQVRSIREHVYPPLVRYMKGRLADPDYRRRFDALILAGFDYTAKDPDSWKEIDYVVATADKPRG